MKKLLLSILAITATSNMMALNIETHYSATFGYNHSFMRASTNIPDYTKQDLKDDTKHYAFDGFEVGGLVDLDFVDILKGNHMIGMQSGLLYTFGDYNFMKDKEYKEDVEDYQSYYKAQGGKWNATKHNYMHVLSIPIRAKYTYTINDTWSVNAITGPEIRFNLALQTISTTYTYMNDITKTTYIRTNYINGNIYGKIVQDGATEIERNAMNKDERFPVFDLGWCFGVGASWNNLSLSFRYDLGMLNMNSKSEKQTMKDMGYKYITNRDAIALTLAYRIK